MRRIVRCRSYPLDTKSAASASSTSGSTAALPRSSTFSTRPRPKSCAHSRFTVARANHGLPGATSQAASAARGDGVESALPSSAAGEAAATGPRSGSLR